MVSGVILFFLGILLVLYNNKHTNKQKISLAKLLTFLKAKNRELMNIRNIIYLFFLGFIGIFLHILFYFLTLKITSISFAMIAFQLTIITIAVYEHGRRLEKLDFFKILYLFILIFCILIIIMVRFQDPSQGSVPISPISIFYLIAFSIFMTFLLLGLGKDSYSSDEIIFLNKNETYKMVRLLMKISFIFFFAIASMFPFIITFYFIPIEVNLHEEIIYFFEELPNIGIYLFNWEMVVLIVFSTIIPYILLFTANLNWSSYNLTYGQWNSIVTVIEPTFALFLGVLLINEYFPIPFLAIVIFLLIISILLRYAHEAHNKVNAYILAECRLGYLNSIPPQLLKFESINSIQALAGTYDLLLNVKTNSIRSLYDLLNEQLVKIDGIINIEILFINKIKKIK